MFIKEAIWHVVGPPSPTHLPLPTLVHVTHDIELATLAQTFQC